MSLTVAADLDACQGYACCLMEAPAVFDLNEEIGKVVVLEAHPTPDQRAVVEAAVRACPAKALALVTE
ncbi:ferredoxin [Nocardioides humi]|uniref:Ferredoxin n=1 Tax=Nocardioides humi TaxID=449461 RepID=A0ABN2AE45_9ACTN|nr:ferredoxin [Nocardioides humi]